MTEPTAADRIRALHSAGESGECEHCHYSYPCPTVQALGGPAAVQPPVDRPALRERLARTIHLSDFPEARWEMRPEDEHEHYRSSADAVLAVLPSPTDQTAMPVCICGHPEERHFEDVCQTCGCGDYLEPKDAAEVIARWRQAALKARDGERAAVFRKAADAAEQTFIHGVVPAASERDEIWDQAVRAVATMLRGTADEAPLSPYYSHEACGFHWHGRDGMDIPMQDGQPVCPRCELAKAEKKMAALQRRRDEIGAESLRRGKIKLEQAEKIRSLERQVDEVQRQLGAEILRAGLAEAEVERMRAERAAVLREEADRIDATRAQFPIAVQNGITWATAELRRHAAECPQCGTTGACNGGPCPLRRLADEAQSAEAHPAEHTWAAELYDPVAEEWVPGTRYTVRDRAVNHLAHAAAIGPKWKDGTPTQRRLVRATTTYTVEPPADGAQQQLEMLPPPEGPEYTPCACRHIEPEHEPTAGTCIKCDCPAYRTKQDGARP
ncbi:hypothetical protein ACFZB5_13750 [Streptomyces nodosus]|uniref:hypothetical protein n=1 Tax=Streptomyces nodosus TaxID=40318 RepID=UPI0036E6DC38